MGIVYPGRLAIPGVLTKLVLLAGARTRNRFMHKALRAYWQNNSTGLFFRSEDVRFKGPRAY